MSQNATGSELSGPDAEREAPRTDTALLSRLIEAARNHKMTPAEVRAQRRSWVRGMTGATDEQLRKIVPELFEQDDAIATLTARAERAEAEVARLRAALTRENDDICQTLGTKVQCSSETEPTCTQPWSDSDGVPYCDACGLYRNTVHRREQEGRRQRTSARGCG